MFEILENIGHKHYSNGKRLVMVKAKCLTCGVEQEMLRQNVVKSNKEQRRHCVTCIDGTFHRLTGTRIWRIWSGIRWRCSDLADKNYGGRGITVDPSWESFDNFYRDMKDGYRDDLTIERIDVNLPYSVTNCRWATNAEQQSNKRNNRYVQYEGETIHLAELVRRSGFSKMMLMMRLNRGMTGDEAVADCRNSGYGKSQRPVNIRRRENRMSTT